MATKTSIFHNSALNHCSVFPQWKTTDDNKYCSQWKGRVGTMKEKSMFAEIEKGYHTMVR